MDSLRKIPSFSSKAVCIADDPVMAAVISSYFNWPNEYFCVLESPRMRRPDYHNEVVKRNNVLASLRPKRVILAGLEEKAVDEFNKRMPARRIVVINNIEEVESQLATFMKVHLTGELRCRKEDLVFGLLIAKQKSKKLIIDKNAPPLSEDILKLIPKTGHTLILDDNKDLAPVITANYAFAINANLAIFPTPPEDKIDEAYLDIRDSQVFKNTQRGKKTTRSLMSQKLTYESYFSATEIDAKFVTFITRGIPYGYFFPDIPSTHLFSYPELGINIFNSIWYNQKIKGTRSALIIDPGFFSDSETNLVIQKLRDMGTYVKELKGDEAKVFLTEMYLQYFPYDLLFICSHAGEIKGEELTIKFTDKEWKEREIVIEEGVGFGLTDEGTGMDRKVIVQHFMGFLKLDGIDWNDKNAKRSVKAGEAVEHFLTIPREKWNIVRRKKINAVRRCVALKLTDDYLQPMFHLVADHGNPIIFNNACVSFYEFSSRLMFSGTRAYIGTLTKVDTDDAKKIAEYIFNNLSNSKMLPLLLWEAQKEVFKNPKDRIYIHLGAHFTNIYPPSENIKEYLKKRLSVSSFRWLERLRENPPEDVKANIKRALKFLKNTFYSL